MAKPSFNGLRVLALESRRAAEIAKLIETFGGVATVAPALREVALSSSPDAAAFARALVRGDYDAVVFLTGVGARALLDNVEGAERQRFITALSGTKVIVRGPKPMAVMREWGVPVWVAAPEPNTWRELLAALDDKPEHLPAGARIAVQEYGASNPELLDGLRARGAVVTPVAVYEWALPEDVEPLKAAARMVSRGEIDVVLFTTQVQLRHLFQIAATLGLESDLHRGLTHAVLASIGPTTSDELRRRRLPVDLEASHPRMGVLVTETAERAQTLRATKQT
jgi:uroporphyrinogen-III synthase